MALGKRTVENAEGWVEGAIQAACMVMSPELPGLLTKWSILVLTTRELSIFQTRPAGWNSSILDEHLLCVPLSKVARLDSWLSINPLVKAFSLFFTDGQRMTLWVARGPWNQYGDVSRAFRAVGASR